MHLIFNFNGTLLLFAIFEFKDESKQIARDGGAPSHRGIALYALTYYPEVTASWLMHAAVIIVFDIIIAESYKSF